MSQSTNNTTLLSRIIKPFIGGKNPSEIAFLRWGAKLLLNRRFPAYELRDRINIELKDSSTVLEVGAGLFEILKDVPKNKIRVGVEIFLPYLENRVCDNDCIAIHGDALAIDQLFMPKSFDSVMLIDVLEHFDPENAIQLINKISTIARKKVIIFVPEGIHPQDKDDRGFNNDYYMTHRSTWYEKDMKALGFSVDVWKNFHGIQGKDPNNMFCVKIINR